MATFTCIKCGKEFDNKYMHKSNICVSCATSPKTNNSAQTNLPKSVYRDKKYLHKLFPVCVNNEEQREKFVGYDTLTGVPYLIDEEVRYEGQAIINSWYGRKLTYEQVALFAQKYAVDSPLVHINNINWKNYLTVNSQAQSSNPVLINSVTRTAAMAFLSNNTYNGSI